MSQLSLSALVFESGSSNPIAFSCNRTASSNSPTSAFAAARTYLLAQKPAQAVEEFDIALSLKFKKADQIQVRKAKALQAAGKTDEAKAIREAILKNDPDHLEAKVALGKDR